MADNWHTRDTPSGVVVSVKANVTVGTPFPPGSRIAVMPSVAGNIVFGFADGTQSSAYACAAGVLSVFPLGANQVVSWTGTGPIDVWS